MDPTLAALLDRLYADGRAHDAAHADRLDRRRNLEPDSARLLNVLVRTARPRSILELGTSNGYSTIWLAEAASAVGARLVSVDVDERSTEAAAGNLAEAGLLEVVQLRTADAADVLTESAVWDLVFLDAERPAYADYWPHLVESLHRPGGLLAVDNVISHAEQVVGFRALVEADRRVRSSVVPIGAGVLLVVRD